MITVIIFLQLMLERGQVSVFDSPICHVRHLMINCFDFCAVFCALETFIALFPSLVDVIRRAEQMD
jgi:hypothetical protein